VVFCELFNSWLISFTPKHEIGEISEPHEILAA
jgi:hypothetical protein